MLYPEEKRFFKSLFLLQIGTVWIQFNTLKKSFSLDMIVFHLNDTSVLKNSSTSCCAATQVKYKKWEHLTLLKSEKITSQDKQKKKKEKADNFKLGDECLLFDYTLVS